ncbi:MAG: hypothetical protein ABI792_01280 [bacterium]
MTSIARFDILNNCLGYGNSEAKIIHFSLFEEYGDWSLIDLLKNNPNYEIRKNDIAKILTDSKSDIIDRINRIDNLLYIDFLEFLNEQVSSKRILNHIDECETK